MKSSKKKKSGDGSGTDKLSQHVETISNALYLDRILSKNLVSNPISRSKSFEKSYSGNKDVSLAKEKKSSWNWKNLISFTKNRRFNCCFSLEVHSIENLPPFFDDLELCVHWKRKDNGLVTNLARVSEGVAEFEDQLRLVCSVYGNRSGPQQSAKYESKHFLLFVAVKDAPELDLGKYSVDLTRFLPLALEELEDEKSSSKWTTSFRLSGMAKGARMNVSFGYSVVGNSLSYISNLKRNNGKSDEIKGMGIQRTESLPAWSSSSSRSGEDIKDLHEVLPIHYHKVEEEKSDLKLGSKFEFEENEHENVDFSSYKHELEGTEGEEKSEENSRTEKLVVPRTDSALGMSFKDDAKCGGTGDEPTMVESSKEDDQCTTESIMIDLDLALHKISVAEIGANSPEHDSSKLEKDNFKINTNYKMKNLAKALSLDDITDLVADEFLTMLGIEESPLELSSESEPESPRESLLRQFEKDTLSTGCSLFDLDAEEGPSEELEDYDLYMNKPRASVLEDLQTEALMCGWGLNENPLVESLPGSPVDTSPDEPHQLPPLGEEVGPFVKSKNGGFLRSMNPVHFIDAKSGGSLVMQASSPVVVPAEMGSGVMQILKGLASEGIEKLSIQANKFMPLDDITGKTMKQVAWEAVPGLEVSDRRLPSEHDYEVEHNLSCGRKREECSEFRKNSDSEYVSLEDLAPLAIDKIEALSIEGLRIQSDMSDVKAPKQIMPQTFSKISLELEGVAGLKLLVTKERNDYDVDSLMNLSLTLDEWLRLDSGEIEDKDGFSERTSKILAAHHACESIWKGLKAEKKRGKSCSCNESGLLGSNFTFALLVQLRDPIRNYEAVGTPMLALIQVERVFRPKFYPIFSNLRNKTEEEEDKDSETKPAEKEVTIEVQKEEERVTLFKISQVHVAGLRTEPGKRKIWGSAAQQQSGSRWLIANGMGKGRQNLGAKPKAVRKSAYPATVTTQPGDTLWSISARVHGNGTKWKELAKLNPHIRNPNIVLHNETIKLR